MTQEQEHKQRAILILQHRTAEQRERLDGIDPRLTEYLTHLCEHSGTELGDENDLHNMYEILCAVRFLRLLRTYDFNAAKVQQVIYDGEGRWQQQGKRWVHLGGGVKQPGRTQPTVYRWEPFQIFALVAIYGPTAWFDTENEIDSRELLPTERENTETGHIEDHRRLCTRFILFGPRKINKSGFGGFINTEDFMRGDYDSQIFCTANSQDQSKILYRKTQDMLRSFDPHEKRIRFTATETNWKEGQFRAASMQALPAGGKMPDGKFASTCCADEYGSAGYTNGRSDMGQTVSVIESSMGPRREPLTIITTTASLITAGPFVEMLDATHKLLLREIDIDAGLTQSTLAEDRQMMLLLEPDEWERGEEYLLSSRSIRRKVNPMLGKIAQHAFYDDEVSKSRMDETKKKETISKLFNVYQAGKVTQWIKGDRIRPLQVPKRITDCRYQDGWIVFAGLDFSSGQDLFGITYLAFNTGQDVPIRGKFFADAEAWVCSEEMEKSPNRALYEKWVEDGWLHVCPGEVFNPDYAITDIIDKTNHGVNIMAFGYDPAQSKQPINTLKAWLQSMGMDNNTIKMMVVPVSQTSMSQTPIIARLEFLILDQEPMLEFSDNPMWPWQFGNCACETTSTDLRRICKGGAYATCKMDNVAALLDALAVFDQAEGH